MSRIFEPVMDILPAAQRRLWPQLRPTAQLGWVLYGGTGVALRLGHRFSVDFDFFSNRPLDRNTLAEAMPFTTRGEVLQDRPNTLTILVSAEQKDAQVKLSFFGGIDFGRAGEPEMTADSTLEVASPLDLMATKLKVILQRIEAKDYRDIAAMLKAGVDLAEGLAAARALYGPAFQPSEGLKALVFFEGGDLFTLSEQDKKTLISATSAVRELPRIAIVSHTLSTTT